MAPKKKAKKKVQTKSGSATKSKSTYHVSFTHSGKSYTGTESAYSQKQANFVVALKKGFGRDFKKLKFKK